MRNADFIVAVPEGANAFVSRRDLPPAEGKAPGSFIYGTRQNRKYLWIILLGSILQITLFKLCYPFPDFISDSYNYIESAALHLNVNLWPIGYAKFLWLFHQITYSDTALVCFQYFFLEGCLVYFFFSFLYLYKPSQLGTKILFVFLFFNPIFLYLSNCVLSDALFCGLSLIWFTQLLWMLRQAKVSHIISLAVLTGLLFTLRYTAIYYPIVAAVAFLLSRQRVSFKLAGILAPAVFIIPFILYTQQKTKEITGTAEFSVFGGWQIANNALYMYGHIKVDPAELPPATVELDRMVKQYYKWAPPGYFNFDDFPGTFFIKHAEAPLKQYMIRKYAKDSDFGGFASWGKVSPMYNAYGKYLIANHPLAFAQYYCWLNVKNYFVPFLEKFGTYNLEEDSVWAPAQYWFHLKTPAVMSISKGLQGVIFFSYPPVFMVLNLYFAFAFCWMLFTGRIRRLSPVFRNGLLLTAAFLLVNFGFSVLATPVVLRYQVIPMVVLFAYSLLLLEYSDSKERAIEKKLESSRVKDQVKAAAVYSMMGMLVLLGGLYCILLLVVDALFKGLTLIFLSLFVVAVLCVGFVRRKYLFITRKHQSELYA